MVYTNKKIIIGCYQRYRGKVTKYNPFILNDECVLADVVCKQEKDKTFTRFYVRAGPLKNLHFNSTNVSTSIVTCSRLCSSLNNVTRKIIKTLCHSYNIRGKVYGIRGGYRGFYDADLLPIILILDIVENIQHEGRTVLRLLRGGFNLDIIVAF